MSSLKRRLGLLMVAGLALGAAPGAPAAPVPAAKTPATPATATPATAARAPAAPVAVPPQLVGGWRLLSITDHRSDGTDGSLPGLGSEVAGYLMIDGNGLACLQATRRDRPRWLEAEGKSAPDDAELLALGRTSLAFCVGGLARHDGSLVGRIVTSSDPNQVGQAWSRPFALAGDRLTLDDAFWVGGLRVRRIAAFQRVAEDEFEAGR